ncbi:MAG: hypothetical protein M1816_007533 [Peltula sp. TS41687]|nr:MAG: hypothetical protein M1816_007533 [Peltula sp. TS41687]
MSGTVRSNEYRHDRPENYRRAIFFPPDKRKPELIWVEVSKQRDPDDDVEFELPHMNSYVSSFPQDYYEGSLLGDDNPLQDRRHIQHNFLRGRDLECTLEITCRANPSGDGSRLNMSVFEVTEGELPHPWRGPIVAFRKEGGGTKPGFLLDEPRFYSDITLQDFRHVVDYFRSYGDEKINESILNNTLDEIELRTKKEVVTENMREERNKFAGAIFSSKGGPTREGLWDQIREDREKLAGARAKLAEARSSSKRGLGDDKPAKKEVVPDKPQKETNKSLEKGSSSTEGLRNDNKSRKTNNELDKALEKAGISARTEDGREKILEELSLTSRKVAPWNTVEGNDKKWAGEAEFKKTLEAKLKSGKRIKGVRISCKGDQQILRAKQYISVDVPADHPIFSSSDPPPDISQLISLPILVSKYPPDRAWKDLGKASMYDNVSATFLNLNADPDNHHWFGWAGPEWQNNVGSVLVVRQDGKDLTIQHVDALCEFCRFRMQPIFEASIEGKKTKEEIMSCLSREKFEKFWSGYREENMRLPREYQEEMMRLMRDHPEEFEGMGEDYRAEMMRGYNDENDADWRNAQSPYSVS